MLATQRSISLVSSQILRASQFQVNNNGGGINCFSTTTPDYKELHEYKKGMEKLFQGIIKYRNTFLGKMVKDFKKVRDNPQPTAVFFTCMDSRMLPTRFTQTNVGDMFIVRNAGNLVPNYADIDPNSISTEPAALELGCVINGIKHVIVCGHSDCKAMNLLFTQRKVQEEQSQSWTMSELRGSPLRAWLNKHALKSLRKYEELEKSKFRRPLLLTAESNIKEYAAYIDQDEKFNETDKLSQVNTLVQMENIASYPSILELVRDGRTHIHALWFDIYTGDIYYFSRRQKSFILIEDNTVDELLSELETKPANGSSSSTNGQGQAVLQEARRQMSMLTSSDNKHDPSCPCCKKS